MGIEHVTTRWPVLIHRRPYLPWTANRGEKWVGESFFNKLLVPCLVNSLYFRAHRKRQCKARRKARSARAPIGNIEHIGKECNAAMALSVSSRVIVEQSRRARPAWLVASLRPLAMRSTITGGPRLPTSHAGHAEMQRINQTGH